MTWEEFWNSIVNYFQGNAQNFMWFGIILVAGLLFIYFFMFLVRHIMRRRKVDPMAIRFTSKTITFLLLVLLVLILLSIVGIPITGLTTALSAVILAVGMALRDFLSNVAAGIVLITSAKYKTGDYIKLANVEGSIVDINFLFTTLKTPDSTQITLPNSTVTSSAVTNLSAYPIRRVVIDLSVAYETDTLLLKKVVKEVLHSNGKILLDPPPNCRLKTLDESSLNFFITCFCDVEDYWDVYFYLMEHLFEECKRNDIEIPFKQLVVANKEAKPMPVDPEPLPERVEKVRHKTGKRLNLFSVEDMSLAELAEANRAYFEEEAERKKAQAEERKKKKKKPAKGGEDK